MVSCQAAFQGLRSHKDAQTSTTNSSTAAGNPPLHHECLALETSPSSALQRGLFLCSMRSLLFFVSGNPSGEQLLLKHCARSAIQSFTRSKSKSIRGHFRGSSILSSLTSCSTLSNGRSGCSQESTPIQGMACTCNRDVIKKQIGRRSSDNLRVTSSLTLQKRTRFHLTTNHLRVNVPSAQRCKRAKSH